MRTSESQETAIQQTEPQEPEERRRWPRFPSKERTRLWFSTPTQGAQRGELVEIAAGGLSIRVVDASAIEVGQQVVVGLGNWMIPARIKTILAQSVSNYRVGMEWVLPGSPAVVALLDHYRPT